jgi:rhamnosyltransferase
VVESLQALEKYWWLITTSQRQAELLLGQPDLSTIQRKLIGAYIGLINHGMMQRINLLKKYQFKKNKRFHTVVLEH